MKTLDLSAVTPSVGIIPQKDTVEHITSSYLEGVASLAKSIIPVSWQTGHLVILHGCVDTGVHPTRTLSAGAVFYNGEVYQVPSASFTTTGSQIGIWTLQDVNTGTESKLTDGSDVHVLVDNKFVFAAGLAGGGLFDEEESEYLDKWLTSGLTTTDFVFNGATTFTATLSFRKRGNILEFSLLVQSEITNDTLWNSGSIAKNTSSFCNLSPDYLANSYSGSGEYVGQGCAGRGNDGFVAGNSLVLLDTESGANRICLGVYLPYNVTNGDLVRIITKGYYRLP